MDRGGGISSFPTMVFVANFTNSFKLDRHAHVAILATLMTAQHLLKVGLLGVLGFVLGAWPGVIIATIAVRLVGTFAGS